MDNHDKIDDLSAKMGVLIDHFSKAQENHDIEHQWVRLAIKREAQSIALRQAIIEKSLAGLVWAGILGLGVLILEYAKAHGWKP